MICSLCNQPITGNHNIDHIYPRAIYKWTEALISAEEFEGLSAVIDSKVNRIPVHIECNIKKNDEMPNISEIMLTEKRRNQLITLGQEIEKYIRMYSDLKKEVYSLQKGCCYKCGGHLHSLGIMRRIDPHGSRIKVNACVVCIECNRARHYKNVIKVQKE